MMEVGLECGIEQFYGGLCAFIEGGYRWDENNGGIKEGGKKYWFPPHWY